MSQTAFSEYRDVIVSFNNAEGQDIVDQDAQVVMSLDAYKAAINKVVEIENQYGKSNASVVDLTDQALVFTGTSRYKLYSFTLTLDISAAKYVFTFVETVPNADSLS
jgi:hypothetical protein